jgi:hypothetical protein
MFSPIIPNRLATDLAAVRSGPDAVKARFLAFAWARMQRIAPLHRYSGAGRLGTSLDRATNSAPQSGPDLFLDFVPGLPVTKLAEGPGAPRVLLNAVPRFAVKDFADD